MRSSGDDVASMAYGLHRRTSPVESCRRRFKDTDLKTALAQQVLVLDREAARLHQRQPQLVRRLILVCRLQFTVGIRVEVELRVVAPPVKKSKFHGAVVLNHRGDLHAIEHASRR